MASKAIRSNLDANQVLRSAYDPEGMRLRVDSQVTASIADMNIHIDAAGGDNVAIASADGLNQLHINADGSLNVNTTIVPTSTGFSNISFSGLVEVNTFSTPVLMANSARRYAHFSNNGTEPIWIQYGSPAAVGRGIRLNVGAVLTLCGYELFLGQINAISQNNINLDILEGI